MSSDDFVVLGEETCTGRTIDNLADAWALSGVAVTTTGFRSNWRESRAARVSSATERNESGMPANRAAFCSP